MRFTNYDIHTNIGGVTSEAGYYCTPMNNGSSTCQVTNVPSTSNTSTNPFLVGSTAGYLPMSALPSSSQSTSNEQSSTSTISTINGLI